MMSIVEYIERELHKLYPESQTYGVSADNWLKTVSAFVVPTPTENMRKFEYRYTEGDEYIKLKNIYSEETIIIPYPEGLEGFGIKASPRPVLSCILSGKES
jgi:hypothetical protein